MKIKFNNELQITKAKIDETFRPGTYYQSSAKLLYLVIADNASLGCFCIISLTENKLVTQGDAVSCIAHLCNFCNITSWYDEDDLELGYSKE